MPGRTPRWVVASLFWLVAVAVVTTSCGPGAPEAESAATATPGVATDQDAEYPKRIGAFREGRERRLRFAGPGGWLSAVDLVWLEPGDHPFGSDPSLSVVLPDDVAPPRAGLFRYDGSTVALVPEPEAGLTIEREPVTQERELPSGPGLTPIVVNLGRLAMVVVGREGRHGIRVYDPENPRAAAFPGLAFYPVDRAHQADARFEKYVEVKPRSVPTVDGSHATLHAPGRLSFELNGQEHSIEPLVYDPGNLDVLFVMFRDSTNGATTYPDGRYLHAGRQGDGYLLDFNKAYNPPCAFTPVATCPVPPVNNVLQTSVEAGEKYRPADGP